MARNDISEGMDSRGDSSPPRRDAADLTISVVVCAFTLDRWDDLRAAVESLIAQRRPAAEIVVVIDHNDDLFAGASRVFTEDAIVVRNLGPSGLCSGRNTGIDHSTGDVVAFLDDDAQADPTWLAALARAYGDGSVLGVGGSIIPRWDTTRPAWFPREFDWVVGCTYRGMPLETSPVRNLIGANMSVRRGVLEAIGGFHLDMGRHGYAGGTADDTEMCLRAQRHFPKSRWIYEPAARVRHRVPDSRTSWDYYLARCRMEGRAKATLSTISTPSQALSSERSYATKVLPAGFLREAVSGIRGDRTGWVRAWAILLGLAVTSFSYLKSTMRLRLDSLRSS